MAKKQGPFNPAEGLFTKPVQEQQAEHERRECEVQEVQQEEKMTLKNTQGRKGRKLPRINMAFTPENHEYITRTSRRQGISATEFVNNLIDKDRCGK